MLTQHPIYQALVKLQEFNNSDHWITQEQSKWILDKLKLESKDLLNFPIKSIVTRSVEEINAWAQSIGCPFILEKTSGFDFLIAAFMEILCEWKQPVHKTIIDTYAAIDTGINSYNLFSYFGTPVLSLAFNNEDTLYSIMTPTSRDFSQLSDEFLADCIENIESKMVPYVGDYPNKIVIPMLNVNISKNLDYLLCSGVIINPDLAAIITVALNKLLFSLNEKGCQVKSAVYVGFSGYSGFSHKQPTWNFIFDKPFLLWLRRSKVKSPYFMGYMEKKYWVTDKEYSLTHISPAFKLNLDISKYA